MQRKFNSGMITVTSTTLAIGVLESAETRIHRLISENPVLIFGRPSCCMSHAMKRLLAAIGVHPTVIEVDDDEIAILRCRYTGGSSFPYLYIGGACVGGLETLVALHLSNNLVPILVEVGAIRTKLSNG